jgi:uncharacterized protein
MCDLHASVLKEVLVQIEPAASVGPPIPPGHPLDTFRRENDALREAVGRMRTAMQAMAQRADAAVPRDKLVAWRQAYNDLMDVEKHYQRKEHLLFSCLERHGITGPSKVLWGKDDEVRALLRQLAGRIPGGRRALTPRRQP